MNPELEESTSLNPQFEKRGGLLPVVVQEASTGAILMLGYANAEAFKLTQESGYAAFYSTSRQKLWIKGETSGDRLRILEIHIDCEQDALLYRVVMEGKGACHTKDESGNTRKSCFYRKVEGENKLGFI